MGIKSVQNFPLFLDAEGRYALRKMSCFASVCIDLSIFIPFVLCLWIWSLTTKSGRFVEFRGCDMNVLFEQNVFVSAIIRRDP